MGSRSGLCVVSVLFAIACFSQNPAPTYTYTLHARKEPRAIWSLTPVVEPPSSVVAFTPDKALLVLIPQAEGKWVLKRLINWDSGTPKEQTINIIGEPSHGKDAWLRADLAVDPGGKYAIVRINSSHGAIGPGERNREAVVLVVELRVFGILSRRVTTEPLLADSQWHFNKDGVLITKGIAKRVSVGSKSLHTVTDSYEAAALTLPDLESSASCHYNEVIELREARNGWTKPTTTEVSEGCTALLEVAGVPSVEDLPGLDGSLERIAKVLNLGSGCMIVDVSDRDQLALSYCAPTRPTWWDSVKMTSRSCEVLSLPHGKAVVSIRLPIKQPIATILGSVAERNYLLLLRDGIKLEVYRLP